jgi:predicted metal-dependent phosphoesterase TrpH
VAELKKAGEEFDFPVIGGVELSVEFSGITHVLGLDLAGSKDRPPLLSGLQKLREERNIRLFNRLNELELTLDWDRLLEISGGGQLGRPHFARAMMEKGYCRSIQEAFDKYLGKGRPAYVPKVRPAPQEAIGLLRSAGFAPVLAHPISLNLPPDKWPDIIPKWKQDGLIGLEAYHPDHNPRVTEFFVQLARHFDLVITAGSDYHGANKKTPLTWVNSRSPVGLEALARLKSRLA